MSEMQPFNLPPEIQDAIDKKLKAGINPNEPTLRSVRPDRRAASPDAQLVDAVSPDARANQNMGKASSTVRPQTPQVIPQFAQQSQKVSIDAAIGSVTGTMRAGDVLAAPEFTTPNEHAPITPISTEGYISIDLPSKFAYYDFKDLYIKPFRIPHLAKLSKAVDVESMQLTCEVVSSVLMTPNGDQNIGFKLAVSDFNALLYWLRANSFKKPTMQVTTTCMNPVHHDWIRNGKPVEGPDGKPMKVKVEASTLEFGSSHDLSVLKTNYLDHLPDPEHYHVVAEVTTANGETSSYRIDLRPETMMDAIEFLDDPRFADAEFQYLARAASYLDADKAFPRYDDKDGKFKRWTLQERIGIIEDHLSTDDVLMILQYSDLVDKFGVEEIVNMKCKECGHVEQTTLTIDARTFLSPSF